MSPTPGPLSPPLRTSRGTSTSRPMAFLKNTLYSTLFHRCSDCSLQALAPLVSAVNDLITICGVTIRPAATVDVYVPPFPACIIFISSTA
ncbi:hypothetical protein CesoFtcFv8_023341 [Champsocephalus esox]|uniref:Uncharacterized protein n=1 Tax=Champsocephalus esox TaxID=159716 RepID=A0AAN8B809_9TELE|nr:hypothetical protein CesoFtcFv8_023341 [Champsocephalus esox]